MKRLEISTLMDEYVDNEFFPEGGSTVDAEAVKDMVLTKAAPARKRRIPRFAQVMLAAALAATLIVTAAGATWALKSYPLFTGGTLKADVVSNGPKENRHSISDIREGLSEDPVVLEDGRLWLVLNGQHTDITNLIDEETPYVIDYTDPVHGLRSSLILGGTPEDFGWVLWQQLPNHGGYVALEHNNRYYYVVLDGVTYKSVVDDLELADYLLSRKDEWESCSEIIWKPWCVKGEQQAKVFDLN